MSHRQVSQQRPLVGGVSRTSAPVGQVPVGKAKEGSHTRLRPCQMNLLEQQNLLQQTFHHQPAQHQNPHQRQNLHQRRNQHQLQNQYQHQNPHQHQSYQQRQPYQPHHVPHLQQQHQQEHQGPPPPPPAPIHHISHDAPLPPHHISHDAQLGWCHTLTSRHTYWEGLDTELRASPAHSRRQAAGTNQLPGRVHLLGERASPQGGRSSQQGEQVHLQGDTANQIVESVHLHAERTNQLPERNLPMGMGSNQRKERSSQWRERTNQLEEITHQFSGGNNQLKEVTHQLSDGTSQLGQMIQQTNDAANQLVEIHQTEQARQHKEPANQLVDRVHQLRETDNENAENTPYNCPQQSDWGVCGVAAQSHQDFPQPPAEDPSPHMPPSQPRVLQHTRPLLTPTSSQQRQDQSHLDQPLREHSQSVLSDMVQVGQSELSVMQHVESQHFVRIHSQSEVQHHALLRDQSQSEEEDHQNQNEKPECSELEKELNPSGQKRDLNQSELEKDLNPSELERDLNLLERGQGQSELERGVNQPELEGRQNQWEGREHFRETVWTTQWKESNAYERRGGEREDITETHQLCVQERPEERPQQELLERPQEERSQLERPQQGLLERPQEERSQLERPQQERPQQDRPLERPQQERPLERPQHERPQQERPQEGLLERPLESPQQDRPQQERPQQDRPQQERPQEGLLERPLERPQQDRPQQERPQQDRPQQERPQEGLLERPQQQGQQHCVQERQNLRERPQQQEFMMDRISGEIGKEEEFMMDRISHERQALPLTKCTGDMSFQSPSHPHSQGSHWQRDGVWAETGTLATLWVPPPPTQLSQSQSGAPPLWPQYHHQATPTPLATPINNQATPTQQAPPNHEDPSVQSPPSNEVTATEAAPTEALPLSICQASVGSRLHRYDEHSGSEDDGEMDQWDGSSPMRKEEEHLDTQSAAIGLLDSSSASQNGRMEEALANQKGQMEETSANQNGQMGETPGMEPFPPNHTAGLESVLSNQNVGSKSLLSSLNTVEESVMPDQLSGMECVLANQIRGVEPVRESSDVVSQAIRDIREAIEEVKHRAVRSPYTLDLPAEPVWVMRPPSPQTDNPPLYHCNSQSENNLLYHCQPTGQSENSLLYRSQPPALSQKTLLYRPQPPTQSENSLLYRSQLPTQSENSLLYYSQPPTQSENSLLYHSQPPTQSENSLLYHSQPPIQSENSLLYHSQPPTQSENSLLYHAQPAAQSENSLLYRAQPAAQSHNSLSYRCNPQSENNLLYHSQSTNQSHGGPLYHCPTLPHTGAAALLQRLQKEHPIPESFASLGKESHKPQLFDVTDSPRVPYEEPPRNLVSFPTFVDVPGPCDPGDLIDGVLFAAVYEGCTQLLSDRHPSKSSRMQQAQEAMSRVTGVSGDQSVMAEVDLFLSTQRIKVLNTETQEVMLDQPLRTISYIADIGNMVVLMARRKMIRSRSAHDQLDSSHHTDPTRDCRRHCRMVCHVFQSEDAQLIAQAIGQAFTVAYQEFLRANGIDPEDLSQRQYSELLNTQDMYNDDLIHFSKTENCRDVYLEKLKGEILGVVIVESGWGSILPTVIIASLMHSGPAARSGRLNIGDQIMTVNGTSLVGLPLNTCQSIIKGLKSQSRVKLNIVRCPPVTMVLIRRPDLRYQLGFSVQNGIICSLMRGGIAERGGVRVGHRIIEINSQSVVATPHEKIVHILSSAVGEIHMKTMPAAMYRLLTAQEQPVYI